ncbi:hypothetical protein KUCAC02_010190, partial [Chaenocephalus aceratus]
TFNVVRAILHGCHSHPQSCPLRSGQLSSRFDDPSSPDTVFEVSQLTVIFILTRHSTSPLSSASPKRSCLSQQTVAQRLFKNR